jgi:glutathione synthetase
MQTPSFLWITDPWSTLDHSKDTTLRLMHEAIKMGIPTFWSASNTLFSEQFHDKVMIADFSKGIPADPESWSCKPVSLSIFQQIHYRIDPPVDQHYLEILDGLIQRGANEKQILNPPNLLRHWSEKIPPLDLNHFAPKMIQVSTPDDVTKAKILLQQCSDLVSKPLHLAQSIGVKKHTTPSTEAEWFQLCKFLTHDFQEKVLLEEFLPEITLGEIRLWFAGQKFIGALKKYPKESDFRVLIDEGSKVEAYILNDQEKKIADEIGRSLQKHGILMAAIDLIGKKICDFNITSPGLLVQLEQVHGNQNFTKEVLNQALQFPGFQGHG